MLLRVCQKKLIEENQFEKAFEVLEESRESVSLEHWTVDFPAVQMAELYFATGKIDEGKNYTQSVLCNLNQWLDYYTSMEDYYFDRIFNDFRYKLFLYQELIKSLDKKAPEDWLKSIKSNYMKYAEILNSKYQFKQ